mgnify:CR=1 FL=1
MDFLSVASEEGTRQKVITKPANKRTTESEERKEP